MDSVKRKDEKEFLMQRVLNSLSYHKPPDHIQDDCERLRAAYKHMAVVAIETCPVGPELEFALRELENSLMWAIKSLVLHVPANDHPVLMSVD